LENFCCPNKKPFAYQLSDGCRYSARAAIDELLINRR